MDNETWRQLDEAHRNYFQEVQTACIDAQEGLRSLQTDYEKAAMRATDHAALFNIAGDFHRQWQDRAAEASPVTACTAAYEKYRDAVVKTLAGVDVEHLDYDTMLALGQSMIMVAVHAGTWAPPWAAQSAPPREQAGSEK